MKVLLKNVLATLGYRIQGTRYTPRQLLESSHHRNLEFDDVVCRRMFEVGTNLNFIQVGAFDGTTRDPLYKYVAKCGWQGILLEPQPKAAKLLWELYRGNGRITIVQAALQQDAGTATLFTVDAANAPDWAGGLASFDRNMMLKHAGQIPGLDAAIKEQTVDCVTFADVLKRLPSDRLDLLQIDAEGGDAHILSLFPLDRIRPAIVHWEVKHLTKQQRETCLDRLASYGYRFAPSGAEDMLAVTF